MDVQETAVEMVRAIRECERLAAQLAALLDDRSRRQLAVRILDIEAYQKLKRIRIPFENIGKRFRDCLEAYGQLLSGSPIICDSPETMDDRSIYLVFSYMEGLTRPAFPRRSFPSSFSSSCSGIVAAIAHLLDLRWNSRRTIRFKDGSELLNRQLAVPRNVPVEAISADNVAGYCSYASFLLHFGGNGQLI